MPMFGKTVVSAWLLSHLGARNLEARYWKPVQAGLEPETDAATVAPSPASPKRAPNRRGEIF
jgi:dethiobiotin synthetase